jgi:hypothetical protein
MYKKFTLENGKLNVQYDFTLEHQRTLVIILANGGVAEFENRELTLLEDVDGNQISWKICDELVEMGLLDEDEESYDVFFELNNDGRNLIMNLEHDLNKQ